MTFISEASKWLDEYQEIRENVDEDATIAFDIYNLSDKDIEEVPGTATFNFVAWR